MSEPIRILVVDDALDYAQMVVEFLRMSEALRDATLKTAGSYDEALRALVENSSDALFLIDAEGRVTYVAASSQRHLGWKPDEMLGQSIFDFLHPDDRELAGIRMNEALQRPGETVAAEVRFKHADTTWRIMEAVGVNRLKDPSVGALIVNARDITERRKLEEQLRQAQDMEPG